MTLNARMNGKIRVQAIFEVDVTSCPPAEILQYLQKELQNAGLSYEGETVTFELTYLPPTTPLEVRREENLPNYVTRVRETARRSVNFLIAVGLSGTVPLFREWEALRELSTRDVTSEETTATIEILNELDDLLEQARVDAEDTKNSANERQKLLNGLLKKKPRLR